MSAGVTMGSTLRTLIRWLGASTNPPAPITEPLENLSRPESTESAVASMTVSRETFCSLIFPGFTCTVISCRRSPHNATLATPGTRRIRARIVQ